MAMIKLRRMTDLQRVAMTPAAGEPVWATDTKKLYIGDAALAGGHPVDTAGGAALSTTAPAALAATASAGTGTTAARADHVHALPAAATTAAAGLMSAADKTKLDGVSVGATAYSHPANHPASIITQDTNNRFVTDAEKLAWGGKAAGNHTHTDYAASTHTHDYAAASHSHGNATDGAAGMTRYATAAEVAAGATVDAAVRPNHLLAAISNAIAGLPIDTGSFANGLSVPNAASITHEMFDGVHYFAVITYYAGLSVRPVMIFTSDNLQTFDFVGVINSNTTKRIGLIKNDLGVFVICPDIANPTKLLSYKLLSNSMTFFKTVDVGVAIVDYFSVGNVPGYGNKICFMGYVGGSNGTKIIAATWDLSANTFTTGIASLTNFTATQDTGQGVIFDQFGSSTTAIGAYVGTYSQSEPHCAIAFSLNAGNITSGLLVRGIVATSSASRAGGVRAMAVCGGYGISMTDTIIDFAAIAMTGGALTFSANKSFTHDGLLAVNKSYLATTYSILSVIDDGANLFLAKPDLTGNNVIIYRFVKATSALAALLAVPKTGVVAVKLIAANGINYLVTMTSGQEGVMQVIEVNLA